MPEIIRVLGPPGTGKTSFLLDQVEEACNHYFPKEIGVVSFTTAAVQEAKDRIIKKLDVTYKEVPGVRTIHAHCYALLGVKPEDIMEKGQNIKCFNEDYPTFQISGANKNDDDTEFRDNDDIFSRVQLLRSRMVPTPEWPDECISFWKAWSEFMENEGKIDFTMMIEECIERDLSPDIKILMIDEAQDLNKLEMTLMRQWSKQCDKVFYIGDGNQAIFRFCGADPNLFIGLDADKVINLTQSYRLSPVVLAKSIEIIKQANVKELVDFKATDKYGPGQIMNVREPDISLPGSHMILCRCRFQVKRYIDALRKANILYCNQYRKEDKLWNPLELDGAESIRVYLRFLRGEELNIYDIKKMSKNCIAKNCMKRGTKKKIEGLPLNEKKLYEFFGLMSMGFLGDFLDQRDSIRDYFRVTAESSDLLFHLAENDPDQFFETPRVCVGSIHSIKGGECDYCWIDPSITGRIKKAIDSDPDAWDDETRVFYTAVTRARKIVGILPTRGYRNPFLGD